MECDSPIWAGMPASYLSLLHSLASKALKIIGIFHSEANTQSLLLSHHRQVGGLSILCRLFSNIASSALSVLWLSAATPECTCSSNNSLLVKLTQTMPTAHLNSFIPHFSHLWNHNPEADLSLLPSRTSNKQCMTISGPPQFWPMIFLFLFFSSPVRRTESYSDTPGMSVSVKMLKFLVSSYFLSNVFIYNTIFYWLQYTNTYIALKLFGSDFTAMLYKKYY